MGAPAKCIPIMDWSLFLATLRRYRNLTSVAREIGLDEQRINRLARGETREPSFSQGVRLLDLASDHFSAEEWGRVRGTLHA